MVLLFQRYCILILFLSSVAPVEEGTKGKVKGTRTVQVGTGPRTAPTNGRTSSIANTGNVSSQSKKQKTNNSSPMDTETGN